MQLFLQLVALAFGMAGGFFVGVAWERRGARKAQRAAADLGGPNDPDPPH